MNVDGVVSENYREILGGAECESQTDDPSLWGYDCLRIVGYISPANARLIAAAPELLALARQYAAECGECNGSGVIEVQVERTVPGCCGRPNADGSCCGNAVPELVPDVETAPCPDCIEIRQVIAKAVVP
jgi:hypothetical protein